MKQIPLSRGLFAIVDDDDFERVSRFKWCAIKSASGRFYAHRRRSEDNPYVSMHTFIMNSTRQETIDHRSGDSLDNRKENLRRCSRQQNGWNRAPDRRSKTGLKGIHYFKPMGKWQSHIRFNNRKIHLGYFRSAEDAARAYDDAAKQYFGEFARLNFQ